MAFLGPRGSMSLEDSPDLFGLCRIKESPNKGRGLFAIKAISPGQTIMSCEALATAQQIEDKLEHYSELVKKIERIIQHHPDRAKELLTLYAGPEMSLSQVPKNQKPITRRIENICRLNAFSDSKCCKIGLWIQPSFINHSCFHCNCSWTVHGDTMVVGSFKDIAEGDEILISYVPPDLVYKERLKTFEQHGFLCCCRLCLMDCGENESVHDKRARLLSTYSRLLNDGNSSCVRQFEDVVKQLDALRPFQQEANPHLIDPMNSVALKLFENGNYEKSAFFLEKLFRILEWYPFSRYALDTALGVTRCYLMVGDHERTEEWVSKLRFCSIARFGTSDFLNLYGNNLLQLLKVRGYKI